MYETDRLPATWVARINAMDEVWVPSHFGLQQFVASGVQSSKIVVVPEAVDSSLFDPQRHTPLPLRGVPDGFFRFLSVFKWEKRKGWDVLLKAYFEEFSDEDPVVLLIKTQAFHSGSDFEQKVESHVSSRAVAAKRPLARYLVLSENLALEQLPRLYRAADAFVLPTRGEGWGRPHVEAMAMALPVIATNWSGSTEFLSELCALPLRYDELREVEEGNGPKGHQWAEPSVSHLRSLMRWVLEHQSEAKAIGARAREEMVRKYSPKAVVEKHVVPHLERIAKSLRSSQEL